MPADVIVVGAGSAGLAGAAELGRRGMRALVLEQGPSVATSWRNRYAELRLNTVRWLSDLPGARIPRSAGRWVGRDDYVAHLEQFARQERLDVRTGVSVGRIDRAEGTGWIVSTNDARYLAHHVVVATGNERIPRRPEWPGRFEGPVLHVADLRRIADLRGRAVLLVGLGNSGVDVAGHLVDAGVSRLWASVRTPPTILPLELAGVPLSPIAVLLRHLPEQVRDATARRLSLLTIGDLTALGLPAPRQGPFERLRTTGVTAAVDRGFVGHLRAGRIEVVPEVARLSGPDVVLHDGRRLRPDVVLTATGFTPGLDPVVGHLGVLDAAGHPREGSARPDPRAPGLWFVGYRPAIEGNLRQHPSEARRVARAIARSAAKAARPKPTPAAHDVCRTPARSLTGTSRPGP
jgi:cation diffusion facilitator CzcD-associated flavoprotein CzcO